MIDEYYTWLIYGYHSDDLKPCSRKRIVAVCDDCGLYRSLRMEQYSDLCKQCTDKYRGHSISKTKSRERDPLPDGWQSKLSDITDKKECGVYLGSIAETILSRIYDNVRVMPPQNPGYDIICNKDYKIDIKSSATGDKGRWKFHIDKNKIADYFLCIAFNNRDDLYNPVHLWMMPGNVVNHLFCASIRKSNTDKWRQYAIPLDKLNTCCTTLKMALSNVKETTL